MFAWKNCQDNIVNPKKVFLRLIENGEGIAFTILSNLNIDIRKLYKDLNNDNKITYGVNLNEENKLYHENDLVYLYWTIEDAIILGSEKSEKFIK